MDRSTVASFKQHLQDLHSQLGTYFPDTSFEFIRNPFGDKTPIEQVSSKLSQKEVDSLVDIASDGTLKTTFREKGLTDIWLHIQPEHPELADSTLKLLIPFPTTYNCEVGFSVCLKTKQRNQINVDYDMRLKLSSLEPDIKLSRPFFLMAEKKKHSSH
jgi:hypothetical protein